ncbi:MAG: pyruvate kinase [Deltaproteobacteria bacterium]|nr:MAG: pyruvate kinase [Deltaproteobacteria bacterium]
MKKAKIVCTVGPSSESEDIIQRMASEGMDTARLNFSHGTVSGHRRMCRAIRRVSDRIGRPIAVLQDLQGPRLRLGKIENDWLELEKGTRLVLTTRKVAGKPGVIPVQYPNFAREVRRGSIVLLADGSVQLEVLDTNGPDVDTRVVVGGRIGTHQGLNLPGTDISSPALTAKDVADLKAGLSMGVDAVALSFVRSPEHVRKARKILSRHSSRALLIAKIEHPLAVERLEDILREADGIMVARGDLGVEMPPEKVPTIQKQAIAMANHRGKLVIVATQMLESMRHQPRPTRAEASDVANAVLDGADALMLSGETASGRYPVEAVRMMKRIVLEAEASSGAGAMPQPLVETEPFANAVANATVVAARDLEVKTIVAFTESGYTARLLSDYRPEAEIVALTPRRQTQRALAMFWGVEPVLVPRVRSTDALIRLVNRTLLEKRLASKGEVVVVTGSIPAGRSGRTNMMKAHVVE